jgi:hypothetical protein
MAFKTPIARIRVLVPNPKKVGSKAWHRFNLYKDGMTPGEYLRAGGTREDLHWDEKRGFIAIPAGESSFSAATAAAPTANRSAAVNRIRALLNKTIENGCTEEEAMAAAAKAGELMDKYGIEQSETQIKAEQCESGIHGAHRARPHPSQWCAKAIADYCACIVYHKTGTGQIIFFGLPADVEVATYLMRVIEGAADRGYDAFKATRAVNHRRTRNDFMLAYTARVSARIREMLKARHTETLVTTTGQSLMVVKNAVVAEQWGDHKLRKAKTTTVATSGSLSAREAGMAAGNKVHLGTAVGTSATKLRLS